MRVIEALIQGFASPPDEAKPRVWWHWMNGNVTKEGIRRDLEWMRRIGIGGLQSFDGGFGTPQVVEERMVYMTPKWRDAFRYATELAEEFGMELAIASSPGWSETGGPWVQAPDGMKKLVWSETRVAGGSSVRPVLAEPPSVTGPFQNLPIVDVISLKEPEDQLFFYKDVAVIGYPTPRALVRDPRPLAIVASDALEDVASLPDGPVARPITLSVARDRPAWVLYDYGTSQRFRAVSLTRPYRPSLTNFSWVVERSDDGQRFYRVTELSRDQMLRRTTVSFPAVMARYLRLTITPVPLKIWFDFAANAPGAQPSPPFVEDAPEVQLNELRFYAGARVHRFEEKAGFAIAARYYPLDSGPVSLDEIIDFEDIIDLSNKMRSDGTLEWLPPTKEEWTILRLGYSLTGKTNHPASPEATGLEVDKLDKRAVKAYMDTYLGNFEKTVGADWIGKKGIRAFLTDSIESAGQNWTPALITEFKARRGYDLKRWLPALTGVVVGDASRTDRFLWDYRRTLMDLISEAHYGQIAECVHARGLIYYSESLEGYPTYAMGDDLDMRQHADIPMAAIWTNYKPAERDGILNHIADMRGAASVAHVLGKNLVAAESLTSGFEPWAFSPATLRPVMDLAFALGVNRPVIHTSVHQPIEKKPGVTLGPYGQHFNRHDTWAEFAGPWIQYLARCSYLLQQGRCVTDVAWFYGEEGSLAGLYDEGQPGDLPDGYGFDFVSANMLLNHIGAESGSLVSSGGARYRVLYLGGSSERMTIAVLRKLKALSNQGVAIAGRRPLGSPSLGDEGLAPEYQRLVQELWDGGKVRSTDHPNSVLADLGVGPDFEYDKPKPDSNVMFLHRRVTDGDIYFLTNRKARPERIEARFRVTGRRPELWHADSGRRDNVSWRIEGQRTVLTLDLYPNQSLFVVFSGSMIKRTEEAAAWEECTLLRLDGDWQLSFEAGRGAPAELLVAPLGSWTDSVCPGIRYFSGVATYRKTFALTLSDLEKGHGLVLDLGKVYELAEVTMNDKPIGIAWHAPFELDVSEALQPGENTVVIRVANLWVNRLIGDKQPGAAPVAFTVSTTYMPNAPLRVSGLKGPVALKRRVVSGSQLSRNG